MSLGLLKQPELALFSSTKLPESLILLNHIHCLMCCTMGSNAKLGRFSVWEQGITVKMWWERWQSDGSGRRGGLCPSGSCYVMKGGEQIHSALVFIQPLIKEKDKHWLQMKPFNKQWWTPSVLAFQDKMCQVSLMHNKQTDLFLIWRCCQSNACIPYMESHTPFDTANVQDMLL